MGLLLQGEKGRLTVPVPSHLIEHPIQIDLKRNRFSRYATGIEIDQDCRVVVTMVVASEEIDGA